MLRISNVLAAALIVTYTAFPSAAPAQCAFEHPKKAPKFQTSLVQAFLGCAVGTNSCCASSNTTTEGGVPACEPPESFAELFGNQPSSWHWDPQGTQGQIALKATTAVPPSPLNPPSNSADMAVQMKLNGVLQQSGPASGNGTLAFVFRATIDDRQSGDMTTVDFPVSITFPMTGGKAKVKTSVDAYLNALPSMQPGLPKCSSTAILFSAVMDPDGATFANAGLFMP